LPPRPQVEARVIQPPQATSHRLPQSQDFRIGEWSGQAQYRHTTVGRPSHKVGESRTPRKRNPAFGDYGTRAVESYNDTNVIGPRAGCICYLAKGKTRDTREYDIAGVQRIF
jgi:hypothetical protein